MPTQLDLPAAENIRTEEELDAAMTVLLDFRQPNGLESYIDTIMGWSVYDEDDYAMCSEETQEYA